MIFCIFKIKTLVNKNISCYFYETSKKVFQTAALYTTFDHLQYYLRHLLLFALLFMLFTLLFTLSTLFTLLFTLF